LRHPSKFYGAVEPLLSYYDLKAFQSGGRPPYWIFIYSKCCRPVGLRGSECVTMPNFGN